MVEAESIRVGSMLTLKETLADQRDLASLCSDRPFPTDELFLGNSFYGANAILKQYTGLPEDFVLKAVLPHGIALSETSVWDAEINAPVPVLFHFSETSRKAYFKAIQKSNIAKFLTPIASPFLYVAKLLENEPKPERKGTLFFPFHSTHRITANFDFEALADLLIALEPEYQPVTVCLYWKDIQLNRHLVFQQRGLPVVSAGHMFDPLFLFRLYHLFSLHQYVSGNELGSHAFYAVKAGCTYFDIDSIQCTYSAESDEILKSDRSDTPLSKILELQSAFKIRPPQPTLEQIQLVDAYVGTDHLLSPNQLKQQLLDAEELHQLMFYPPTFAAISDPRLEASLDEIPSETTPAERRLLYNFFARIWPGRHNVCEIGPFLGGTSRAIALGMQANPHRDLKSQLYTYDRFANYYSGDRLMTYLQPLFENGTLDPQFHKPSTDAKFLDIFQVIHSQQAYSSVLVTKDQALPTTSAEVGQLANLFHLPKDLEFDAIFIDGCKSWYATKYFLLEVSQHIQPQTFLIFQDYGWYTCFWLPLVIYLLKDYLKFVSCTDNTYILVLIHQIQPECIDRLCPDALDSSHQDLIDRAFTTLWLIAQKRFDWRAMISLTLQHGAALTYIGCLDAAKAKMIGLATQTWAKDYRSMIEPALRYPTYLPDGTPIELFSTEEVERLLQEIVWLNPYQADLNYWQTQFQQWQQTQQQMQSQLDQLQQSLDQKHTELQTIPDLQNELEQLRAQLKKSRQRVKRLNTKLEQSQKQLTAIEQSKFWKLRSIWIRFKRMMGRK